MTRFAIDALVAIRLAEQQAVVPAEHSLVAPSALRSDVLSIVYRDVRAGRRTDADARALLDRVTGMRIRLLGDRVSRSTAWSIAARLDRDDIGDAEHLAVATLQADCLVTLDDRLARAADGIVPLGSIADITV